MECRLRTCISVPSSFTCIDLSTPAAVGRRRSGMVRTAGGIANKPDCPNRSQCRAAVAGRRRSRRRAAIAARAGPGATGASESLSVSHGHRDSHPPAAGPFWVGPLRSVAAAAEAAAAAAPPPDAGDPPMRRRRPCPQLPGPKLEAWARFTGIMSRHSLGLWPGPSCGNCNRRMWTSA